MFPKIGKSSRILGTTLTPFNDELGQSIEKPRKEVTAGGGVEGGRSLEILESKKLEKTFFLFANMFYVLPVNFISPFMLM